MIRFSDFDSCYFVENKTFVEKQISDLKQFGFEAEGFCNAYGFEILLNAPHVSAPFIRIHKAHISRSWRWDTTPLNHYNFVLKFKINQTGSLRFGKGSWFRWSWQKKSFQNMTYVYHELDERSLPLFEHLLSTEGVLNLSLREGEVYMSGYKLPTNWPAILNGIYRYID